MDPLHFDLPSPTEATRRMFLSTHAGHVGLLALASMLAQQQSGKASESTSVAPDVAPKAKSVICLFQNGGPSQMDLFDPKPFIQQKHGQTIDSPLPKQILQVYCTVSD